MEEFKKIKSFSDEAQFNDLLEILKKNNIPFQSEAYRERHGFGKFDKFATRIY